MDTPRYLTLVIFSLQGRSPDRQSSFDGKKQKSFEEREEEYEKARARIFNQDVRITLWCIRIETKKLCKVFVFGLVLREKLPNFFLEILS
jgi:glycyl-tRNA synthetase beta subunit